MGWYAKGRGPSLRVLCFVLCLVVLGDEPRTFTLSCSTELQPSPASIFHFERGSHLVAQAGLKFILVPPEIVGVHHYGRLGLIN